MKKISAKEFDAGEDISEFVDVILSMTISWAPSPAR